MLQDYEGTKLLFNKEAQSLLIIKQNSWLLICLLLPIAIDSFVPIETNKTHES
jgi:hypothetical protein